MKKQPSLRTLLWARRYLTDRATRLERHHCHRAARRTVHALEMVNSHLGMVS